MSSDLCQIHVGDCREKLRLLSDNSIDAGICDPPYELGFMGKTWDSSGIAYDVEMWRQVLRVLKPGAHLLAFGGSRTYHRLASAIEDAGFDIRDQIMWIYGSGFPKSRNLDGDWEGWGTALKPAHEPIVMARKPLSGTVAANVLQHGTGALNIEAIRIGVADGDERQGGFGQGKRPWQTGYIGGNTVKVGSDVGRWPANVIHDGSSDVVALFPRDAGAAAPVRGTEASAASNGDVTGERARVPGAFHGDVGSAARFFYCAKAGREDRDDGLDGVQARKNFHPTVKPLDLMRYLCRMVTPRGGGNPRPLHGFGLYRPGCVARTVPVHRHRYFARVCGPCAPADSGNGAAAICRGRVK